MKIAIMNEIRSRIQIRRMTIHDARHVVLHLSCKADRRTTQSQTGS